MGCLRGAVSLLPVVGPALDAAESISQGDRVGAAMELCGLVADVCGAFGQARTVCRSARLVASHRGTYQVASRVARLAASTVRGARHVAKTALKWKVKGRLRSVAVKVGWAAGALLVESAVARSASWRARGTKLRSRMPISKALATFAQESCDDARLHAVLARAVYHPTSERRGVLVDILNGGGSSANSGWDAEVCWYAYVGGDNCRGFWYSPSQQHLILVERGTAIHDLEDLRRDVCLASGSGLAAVSGRVQASKARLLEQVQCHDCQRITLAGHSLGGTVAVSVACSPPHGVSVDLAHVFNPGGLPDLTRLFTCCSASAKIVVHRIQGDPVSVGFLPLMQRTYAKRHSCEALDSHRMLHFVDEDIKADACHNADEIPSSS